jgi:flagellar protein FliS
MYGLARNGASAYAKVGIETGVLAASPHKLIMMLFDGALLAVLMGVQHMKAGEIAKKGSAVSKAIMIIDNGLRASLDKKAGGEIAQNLDSLYAYMSERLLMGNLKNKPEMLEEVHALLKDLRSAWEAIDTSVHSAAAAAPAVTARAYDALAPRVSSFVSA